MRRLTGTMSSSGPASSSRQPDQVAAERAVAQCCDQARLGHGLVGRSQRRRHPRGDGTGDQQHVCVARRGHDVQTELLEVVEGVGGSGELVLASVAGARVDVAQRERTAPAWRRCGDRVSQSLEVVEQYEHGQRSTQA